MTIQDNSKELRRETSTMEFAGPHHSRSHMLFRKLVRWMVASIMYYSGAVFLYNLFKMEAKARILVYHSIDNDPLNPFSVSPEDFEEQVRFLSQEYNVISLDELVAYVRGEREKIAPDSVVITLDDGLRDNYVHAYPILRRHDVPATIFVIVACLESHDTPQSKVEGQGSGRYLSWDQVVEMSENGVSFGSHTLMHPRLTKIKPEEARREIAESKILLEQRLGKSVRLFAYPGGRLCDFNQDIKTAVAESEYSGACVGLNGTNAYGTDPYLLRRTKIEVDDGMYVFKKAMKGALDIFALLDKVRGFSA